MLKYILVLSILVSMVGCSSSSNDENTTTFIIVRHAEKVKDESGDPPLTEKGEARAQMLAGMMSIKGLDKIYSTPFDRNLSTVIPTAKVLDISINEYDPSRDLGDFLSNLVEKHPGERILICGHSNTVPNMLNILAGETTYEQLNENDYDNIYYVDLTGLGNSEITEATFEPALTEDQ